MFRMVLTVFGIGWIRPHEVEIYEQETDFRSVFISYESDTLG
jgi:hypothetical protein